MTDSEPRDETPLPERPSGIRMDEPLAPRGPWSFLREVLVAPPGRWGWHLIGAWVFFQGLGSAAWAMHLRSFAGYGSGSEGGSGLPSHWGGLLTARDIWELAENGNLKLDPFGQAAPILSLLALLWVLWAGWKLQAEAAGTPGRLVPWLAGVVDALLLGGLPLALLGGLLLGILRWMGGLGFAWMGWLNLAGGGLLRLTLVSAFMLQWWFCRLGRDAEAPKGFLLGGWPAYGQHLGRSFLRLWMHPVQWGSILLGGSFLRAGASLAALWIGWRMGGDGPFRVWGFLLIQAAALGLGAWLLGCSLRLAALFFAQDRRVRLAKDELEAKFSLPEPGDAEA